MDATRRQLLLKVVGGLTVLAGVEGCKKALAFTCVDTAGLTPGELQTRTTLGYVDQTPEAGNACANCQQWVPPAGDACGGCKVLKGPAHPNGWCKIYARKG